MSAGGAIAWRPAADLAAARRRAAMLERARRFFADHGILEVETAALSPAAVSDPAIESIRAVAAGRDRFLHTSPEFAMKRLLAAGWPDIYQVARVFRDGEVGHLHQPEFTLVEWYRHGLALMDMADHAVEFLAALLEPRVLTATPRRLGYVEAFTEGCGVHPLDDDDAALEAAAGADRRLADALGDDRDAWLDLLLAERIAPAFPRDRLTVLHHYPASQAALARRCPDDPRLADRFEVFFGGLELANGYVELTDAAEQRRRFERDQARRRREGKAVRPLDAAFLEALEHGLPPCAGVAVGFDRLVMINCDTQDVRRVLTFPVYGTEP